MTNNTGVGHHQTPLLSQTRGPTQRTQLLQEYEHENNNRGPQLGWDTLVMADDMNKLYLQDSAFSSASVEFNSVNRFFKYSDPNTFKSSNVCLDSVVRFIRSLPVQLFFVFMITFDCVLILYGYFSNTGQIFPFSIALVFILLLGHLLILLKQRRYHYSPPCNRRQIIVADCLLLVSFLLELITLTIWCITKNVTVTITALPAVAILYYPQLRCLTLALRHRVSLDRRRYCSGGFDLDITFIDPTLVATSWPATGFESIFRNPGKEVENLLDIKYGIHAYHVFNLCAERGYDNTTLFHGDASRYPIDDHCPPELEMMIDLVREASRFVQKDPRHRSIVLHCKGGKGRTGTMACAYLLSRGIMQTAEDALEYFGSMRTARGGEFQGVQTPSQRRYVCYFAQLISNMTPGMELSVKSQTKRITQISLLSIPPTWWKGGVGKLWFVIMVKPSTERRVIYISNPNVNFDASVPRSTSTALWSSLRDIYIPNEDSLYSRAQQMESKNEVAPYHDTFTVKIGNEQMTSVEFDSRYADHSVENNPYPNVSLDLLHLEKLPPITGDVVIKFYHSKKKANAFEVPVQLWFHTAMEGDKLHFDRSELDGPHKDKKSELYPSDFAVTINLQTEPEVN